MRYFFSGPRVFGIRSGVSFGPEDFRRRQCHVASQSAAGGYVYVIQRDGDDRIKIGSSIDPQRRIASLQTGSADALTIAFQTFVEGDYVGVELAAHETLDRHRGLGEWFSVPVEVAVAAISAASYRIGKNRFSKPIIKSDSPLFLRSFAIWLPAWMAVAADHQLLFITYTLIASVIIGSILTLRGKMELRAIAIFFAAALLAMGPGVLAAKIVGL